MNGDCIDDSDGFSAGVFAYSDTHFVSVKVTSAYLFKVALVNYTDFSTSWARQIQNFATFQYRNATVTADSDYIFIASDNLSQNTVRIFILNATDGTTSIEQELSTSYQ